MRDGQQRDGNGWGGMRNNMAQNPMAGASFQAHGFNHGTGYGFQPMMMRGQGYGMAEMSDPFGNRYTAPRGNLMAGPQGAAGMMPAMQTASDGPLYYVPQPSMVQPMVPVPMQMARPQTDRSGFGPGVPTGPVMMQPPQQTHMLMHPGLSHPASALQMTGQHPLQPMMQHRPPMPLHAPSSLQQMQPFSHSQQIPPPPPPPPSASTSNSQPVEAPKRKVQKGLEENVKRTIYVSYIDIMISEEQLANFFSQCGPVMDCRICADPNSAMRFAFLEFADIASAQKALSMSGTMLGGWPLRIQPSKTAIVPVSKDLMPRSQEEFIRCSRTVYVASIDKRVEKHDLCAFFESLCGPVAKLRLLGDATHNTRIAFVEFVSAEGALAALNCSGALLGSLPVRVSPSKTPIRTDTRAGRVAGGGGTSKEKSRDKDRERRRDKEKDKKKQAERSGSSGELEGQQAEASASAGGDHSLQGPGPGSEDGQDGGALVEEAGVDEAQDEAGALGQPVCSNGGGEVEEAPLDAAVQALSAITLEADDPTLEEDAEKVLS